MGIRETNRWGKVYGRTVIQLDVFQVILVTSLLQSLMLAEASQQKQA